MKKVTLLQIPKYFRKTRKSIKYSKITLFLSAAIVFVCGCGLNTYEDLNASKIIIEKSKLIYTKDVTDRLEKIIQPHYLGVDDISTGHNYKPKHFL